MVDKKQAVQRTDARPGSAPTTKRLGDDAEDRALAHLQAAGLALVRRNFKTPGRGGGEIDLIMRDADGTLVFVEVRRRSGQAHGGAAASVTWAKQRRLVFAARHFLLRLNPVPPCRFDVVLWDGSGIGGEPPALRWLQGAFDASGWT